MKLWRAEMPLILASRSKVRAALLGAAGIAAEVQPADIDERGIEAETAMQTPQAVAALLAREKAVAMARLRPGRLVLGADQVLALGARRFAKPADRDAARDQLRTLRGQTHELHSAIAFAEDSVVRFEYVGLARLTMRAFSNEFLEEYLDAAGEAVTASVGAYQLEGIGIQLFERIEGDYFTVLGLPLLEASAFLRQNGYLVP